MSGTNVTSKPLFLPSALTGINTVFCISQFCVILTINSDYFYQQHLPFHLFNSEVFCFSSGTDWFLLD